MDTPETANAQVALHSQRYERGARLRKEPLEPPRDCLISGQLVKSRQPECLIAMLLLETDLSQHGLRPLAQRSGVKASPPWRCAGDAVLLGFITVRARLRELATDIEPNERAGLPPADLWKRHGERRRRAVGWPPWQRSPGRA